MQNLTSKLILSFLNVAIIFILFSSKTMFELTQSLFGSIFTVAFKGCPTTAGLLLHGLLFALLNTYIHNLLYSVESKLELYENDKKKKY
jgi:ABC-type Mn2+/Zn2+ transport system permease subunit